MTEGDPPLMKDSFRYNYKTVELSYEMAKANFDYMIRRRDEQAGKIDFGIITINGASFVALLSSISSAQWMHIDPSRAIYSAAAFVVGVTAAGYCALFTLTRFNNEAVVAVTHVYALQRQLSLLEKPRTKQAEDEFGKALEDPHLKEPVGFQYSKMALALRSIATGLWLFGASNLLVPAISQSWHSGKDTAIVKSARTAKPKPTPLPGTPSTPRS